MIFGTVTDPQAAAVPTAKVVIANTETGVSMPVTTNANGYYELRLLLTGTYKVTVEVAGFRTAVRDKIQLPAGSYTQVDMALTLGQVSETIAVSAEAALIDMNSASSGAVLQSRTVRDVPMGSNNPTMLVELAPGVQTTNTGYAGTREPNMPHGVGGSSQFQTSGNVGGNTFQIDGTNNDGSNRRIAYVPVGEMIEEVKIETSGFDASVGHTTGISVAMVSKSGTNLLHGVVRELHTQDQWNAVPYFMKVDYDNKVASARAAGDITSVQSLLANGPRPPAHQNHYAAALGGPVYLPKILDGRNKLFFFFGYTGFRVGNSNFTQNTVPTRAERGGDFSQLLKVAPDGATKYQLYDPLSVRPDPSRPSHYVRDPLPGNIVPKSGILAPTVYNSYLKLMPLPNNPQSDPAKENLYNFLAVNPSTNDYQAYNNRIDYNLSPRNRFFGRWSWNQWNAYNPGWLYAISPLSVSEHDDFRQNVGGVIDWVATVGPNTVFDTAFSVNQYKEWNAYPGIDQFKPSTVGLPAYLDQKAGNNAILPAMSFSGYNGFGDNKPGGTAWRTLNFKTDIFHTRGQHTLRAGLDSRFSFRTSRAPGNTSGNFGFSNAYLRREDDGATPTGSLGFGWAAFMMGLPNGLSVASNDDSAMENPYYGLFVQDQWRVTRTLTVNAGVRMEYELGPTERYNRMLGYMDFGAKLPINDAAQTAYAAGSVAQLAPAQFSVLGGSIYPGVNGRSRSLWHNNLSLLPRLAAAWQMKPKTVIRAGYGLFFDTLNVLNEGPDQTGFSRTTSSTVTNDFGSTWLLGNPGAGTSPLTDPFPVRSDGTRFDPPVRDSLGLMSKVGRGWTVNPWDRKPARQQRWRASLSHQIGSSTVVEAAYAGSYSDRVEVTRNLAYLPENYWATGTVRDFTQTTLMNENVTNPFYIANFASMATSSPQVYQDMTTNSFFTSRTISRNRLLRAYPQMNGLSERVPLGKVKTHDFILNVDRRFSKGFNLSVSYTRDYNQTADFFWNEFDAQPTWRESSASRPHRLVGTTVIDLPFGKGRPLLQHGILSHIAGGWTLSGIYEFQPGWLLDFGNVFYSGDLAAIPLPASQRTLDRWFNTNGFERAATKSPNSYNVRTFPTRVPNLRSDITNNWNGSVMRNFQVKESIRLQLKLDAIDLFNRTTFGPVSTNPTASDFGRVTNTYGPYRRWLQVQAKLDF